MAWLCWQLGVARSGYYAWRQRQEAPRKRAGEDTRLTAEIQAVFGDHRVARHMQRADLRARTRKPFRPCSGARRGATGVVENLLRQDFQPPAPNRCWAGDISYIRTRAG